MKKNDHINSFEPKFNKRKNTLLSFERLHMIDNITFIGDWKIMFKTVGKVFKREGITSATSVTMEEFKGSEAEVVVNE